MWLRRLFPLGLALVTVCSVGDGAIPAGLVTLAKHAIPLIVTVTKSCQVNQPRHQVLIPKYNHHTNKIYTFFYVFL